MPRVSAWYQNNTVPRSTTTVDAVSLCRTYLNGAQRLVPRRVHVLLGVGKISEVAPNSIALIQLVKQSFQELRSILLLGDITVAPVM